MIDGCAKVPEGLQETLIRRIVFDVQTPFSISCV
jgi:hypothetical protein